MDFALENEQLSRKAFNTYSRLLTIKRRQLERDLTSQDTDPIVKEYIAAWDVPELLQKYINLHENELKRFSAAQQRELRADRRARSIKN